jgi:hypothetical protein
MGISTPKRTREDKVETEFSFAPIFSECSTLPTPSKIDPSAMEERLLLFGGFANLTAMDRE